MNGTEFWKKYRGHIGSPGKVAQYYIKFAEAYASHERERMLNLSDLEIEEIVKHSRDPVDFVYEWRILCTGAKALLNHLKEDK